MTALSSGSFTSVQVEATQQGAPVSEFLAQQLGSNENNLDARVTANDGDIATNVTDIATNTADIAALIKPNAFNFVGLTVNTVSSTVATFSSAPRSVILKVNIVSPVQNDTIFINTTDPTTTIAVGAETMTFTLSGTSLLAVVTGSSFGVAIHGEAFF